MNAKFRRNLHILHLLEKRFLSIRGLGDIREDISGCGTHGTVKASGPLVEKNMKVFLSRIFYAKISRIIENVVTI